MAGPPKRFAQAIGVVFSTTSALLFYVFDAPTAGYVVLGALTAAATLESAFGFCLGCKAFALLMRVGVIPQEVCESCNNIWADRPARPSRRRRPRPTLGRAATAYRGLLGPGSVGGD